MKWARARQCRCWCMQIGAILKQIISWFFVFSISLFLSSENTHLWSYGYPDDWWSNRNTNRALNPFQVLFWDFRCVELLNPHNKPVWETEAWEVRESLQNQKGLAWGRARIPSQAVTLWRIIGNSCYKAEDIHICVFHEQTYFRIDNGKGQPKWWKIWNTVKTRGFIIL